MHDIKLILNFKQLFYAATLQFSHGKETLKYIKPYITYTIVQNRLTCVKF